MVINARILSSHCAMSYQSYCDYSNFQNSPILYGNLTTLSATSTHQTTLSLMQKEFMNLTNSC